MHEADDDRATIAQTTSKWPVGNAERAGESAGYGHMPASEDHMVGSFGEAPAPASGCEIETVSALAVFGSRRCISFEKTDVIFVILMLYL